MELIENKENQIVFSTEIEESLANAIRRSLNLIPIIAIDEVEISKNDSPLYDETVAHRLGLIPLKIDKKIDEKKKYSLKLDTKKEGFVYSEELKGPIKVVYDKVPITLLQKGQELSLVAKVGVGKGNEHSKFSPGLMYYRNMSEITINKELRNDIENVCPNNKIKEKGDKIIILDNLAVEVCDVCEGICKEKGKKWETNVSKDLIITLESFGQLEAKEIFNKAIETLKKDLAEVSKKISKA